MISHFGICKNIKVVGKKIAINCKLAILVIANC